MSGDVQNTWCSKLLERRFRCVLAEKHTRPGKETVDVLRFSVCRRKRCEVEVSVILACSNAAELVFCTDVCDSCGGGCGRCGFAEPGIGNNHRLRLLRARHLHPQQIAAGG